jgi:hypothetical protein
MWNEAVDGREIILYGKAFAASAGPGSVGVNELEALAVQTIRKIKDGAQKVKQTLFVYQDLNTFILKYLVGRVYVIVEVKVVHQPGTASAFDGHADIVFGRPAFLAAKFDNPFLCFLSNSDHLQVTIL